MRAMHRLQLSVDQAGLFGAPDLIWFLPMYSAVRSVANAWSASKARLEGLGILLRAARMVANALPVCATARPTAQSVQKPPTKK